MAASVPLTALLRAGVRESIHRGSVVVTRRGEVQFACGDATQPVFLRSTAKPFQAMVLVTSGAADRFGLGDEALAVAAGSHDARPAQLAAVLSILEAAGLTEADLGCGGHWSIAPEHARTQARAHAIDPDPLPALWSNCSGKHAAMLAAAKAMDVPHARYLDPDHAVQRAIHELIAAFAGLDSHTLSVGIDGCGAPIAAVPLENIARALGRLGAPDDLAEPLRTGAARIGRAMAAHPAMVAGEGRFDTDLMVTTGGAVLSKAGAEGVHGVAVPSLGLGIAVKVDDGNDRGYLQVVIELLRREGVLSDADAAALAERHGRTVRNWSGTRAGHLEVLI